MSRSKKKPYILIACAPKGARTRMKQIFRGSYRRDHKVRLLNGDESSDHPLKHRERWDLPGETKVYCKQTKASRK